MDEGGAAPPFSPSTKAWTSIAANSTTPMDHHSRPPIVDNRPTTPKDNSMGSSTFRGPGGSPILERSSPIFHRPYHSTSSIGSDRRDSNSVSPTLTRQENNPNPLRMLPPPSPPAQRHQQSYTGMDLPPLSSLTTGLPHRPPSSSSSVGSGGGGGMSISALLGGSSAPGSSSDMGMHHHHHHHSSHHHQHQPPQLPQSQSQHQPPHQHQQSRSGPPYTPEYGNPLVPSSSAATAQQSQSTPTTPAIGYNDNNDSSHGRSNSYGRLPSSSSNVLPTPFRDNLYRGYVPGRNPSLPHQRDEYPPLRPTETMSAEQAPPSPPHLPDVPKPTPYSSVPTKHPALNTGIPPPAPHQSHQQHSSSRAVAIPAPPRPSHHHHHSRPSSQPSRQAPAQSRPLPKVTVNNTPALDAVAQINPKPFLGRFIYEPGWVIPAAIVEDNVGGRFEVRIPQRFLKRENEAVAQRKLWGTGVYTDDSDVVAILYHTSTLPPAALHRPTDMAAHFLILPTLQHYTASTQNELRSRGWKVHDGFSIYLERVEKINVGEAEGGWRGRKRRLDEEFRMEVDSEGVGIGSDVAGIAGFKEVRWGTEQFSSKRRTSGFTR